ncbi:MAG: CvpA family protein [Planctomycetaceae bacterium]
MVDLQQAVMNVTWYDMAMIGMLVFAVIRGAVKGFVWQLAAIAAIVLCFYCAGSLSLLLAPMIPNVEPPANRWVAMFLLYLAFSFLSFGAARVLRGWIEKAKFVEYDRHLGAIFGLVKGVTFCLVVTFFVVTLLPDLRETVVQSHSSYGAAVIVDRLHPVMPDNMHDVLEPYIHQLDRPGMDLKFSHPPEVSEGHVHDNDHPVSGQNGEETRTSLLEAISAVFAESPADRAAIVEETERALNDIPKDISLAVLRDWRADLLFLKPDPDPQTDQTATLDARIIRQLAAARIPISSLDPSLRNRLNGSLRQ